MTYTINKPDCHYRRNWCGRVTEPCDPDRLDCDRTMVISAGKDNALAAEAVAIRLSELTCVQMIQSHNLKKQLGWARKHDILDVVIVGEDLVCKYMPKGTELHVKRPEFFMLEDQWLCRTWEALCSAERIGEKV